MKNKGFTLIELLVVIAIIGILSSVVLASLNSARNKGQDAAIKANLSGIRAAAELYYDSNANTYGASGTGLASTTGAASVCAGGLFSDSSISAAISAAATASGQTNPVICGSYPTGANTVQSWAIIVKYKSDSAKGWCVGSSGASRETVTLAAAELKATCTP